MQITYAFTFSQCECPFHVRFMQFDDNINIAKRFNNVFPEKLKKLRKEKDLTQEELANAIFVSKTLISK